MDERLIVGISGASGMPLAIALLQALKRSGVEIHLVITEAGLLTLRHETGLSLRDLDALADCVHSLREIGAAPASGSFQTMGMVVVPCSMKTVAGIACGYSDNLLLRAADVTLKERRKLVLVAREAPLSTIHLRNLCTLSELGAVILPPMLEYYTHPKTLDDMVQHIVGRILDQFHIEGWTVPRWEGL